MFGVLRIYRNVQTLLDYSERDTLTGLLNRKIFDDSFYKVSSLPLLDAKLDESERRHAVRLALLAGRGRHRPLQERQRPLRPPDRR